jgi:hypothetical protein
VYSGFLCGKVKERDHFRKLEVDGMIILKLIFKKCDWGVDWINLAQERDRWRALVKAALNTRLI